MADEKIPERCPKCGALIWEDEGQEHVCRNA